MLVERGGDASMQSLGEILKAERENRGLSLPEVREATKITVPNLSALEEDRFDYFPNRVYARAFLRDYSNFLGLDSAALLIQYEEQWNVSREAQLPPKPRASVWRAAGYFFLALIIVGGLTAAGYFGWIEYEKRAASRVGVPEPAATHEGGAPQPEPEPVLPPEPEPPPLPDKLALQVTALREVWVRVIPDGGKNLDYNLRGGDVKTFEAKKSIFIRVGMANSVKLKLNGEPLPPLGTLSRPAQKTYRLEDVLTRPPTSQGPAGVISPCAELCRQYAHASLRLGNLAYHSASS